MIEFWIAFGSSAVLAWPVYRMLLALKSRQTVSQYAPEGHQAKQGTPTMGGLMMLPGFLAAMIFTPLGPMVAASVLFLGFAAIGFADDFIVPRMTGKRGLEI